jgi:hypothetical protein
MRKEFEIEERYVALFCVDCLWGDTCKKEFEIMCKDFYPMFEDECDEDVREYFQSLRERAEDYQLIIDEME